MGKPRMLGQFSPFVPNKRRDLRYCKKIQRNRETEQRNPVAGKITKEKEQHNNGQA